MQKIFTIERGWGGDSNCTLMGQLHVEEQKSDAVKFLMRTQMCPQLSGLWVRSVAWGCAHLRSRVDLCFVVDQQLHNLRPTFHATVPERVNIHVDGVADAILPSSHIEATVSAAKLQVREYLCFTQWFISRHIRINFVEILWSFAVRNVKL